MTGPRAPNLEAITESIQRSLQNCSLGSSRRDSNNYSTSGGGRGGRHRSSRSESGENMHNITHFSNDNTLELNSQIRLPYYWEQCLDLNTGEVYYINWRTGMKSRHHPRTMNARTGNGTGTNSNIIGQELQEQGYVDSEGSYSEEEHDDEEEEESSSPSPSSSTTTTTITTTTTTTTWRSERCAPPMANTNVVRSGSDYHQYQVESENENESSSSSSSNNNNHDFNNYIIKAAGGEEVLVVAGCKGCFMYLMVPKQVEECPKCCGQLLHFDRSGSGSGSDN